MLPYTEKIKIVNLVASLDLMIKIDINLLMEESKALNFINGIIGKAVNVTLKDGTIYFGKLKSFDIHTNIVLENCEEINQEKRRKLNQFFIAGRNLESCWLNENR